MELQLTSNGTIVEMGYDQSMTAVNLQASNQAIGQYTNGLGLYQPYTQWCGYPVYVCEDKTKKAIEVLKTLQADKILEVKSVNKFIELVEKISSIL